MRVKQPYFKFLSLKHHNTEAFIKKYEINHRCILLLEFIATCELNSSLLTISQLMHKDKFGSPATIHRSLSILRDSGLLIFLHHGTNLRTKYPALTSQSKDYFDSISRVLLDTIKPNLD